MFFNFKQPWLYLSFSHYLELKYWTWSWVLFRKKKSHLYHDTNSLFCNFSVNYSIKNMLNIIEKLFNGLFLTIFPQAVRALSCVNLISIQLLIMRAGYVLIVYMYVLCLTTRSSSRFLHSLRKLEPFWRMPRIGGAMVIVFTLNAHDRGLDPPSDNNKDNTKSLTVPKGYSEPLYRQTNNTMAKSTRRKEQTTIYIQHTTVHRQLMIGQKQKHNNRSGLICLRGVVSSVLLVAFTVVLLFQIR